MKTVKTLAAACTAALMVAGCLVGSAALAQTVPNAPPSLTSQSSPTTTGDDSTGATGLPGDNTGLSVFTFNCIGVGGGNGNGKGCGKASPPPPPPPPKCSVPPPSTRDVPATLACPAGQVGQESVVNHQEATWSCPATSGAPVEGPWTTVSTTVVSNTCAAACVAPPTTVITQSQTASCPAGQVYKGGPATKFTQTRQASTSWSCPAAAGSPVSSTTYTAWSPAASAVCAPTPPPAAWSISSQRMCVHPVAPLGGMGGGGACSSGSTESWSSSGGLDCTYTVKIAYNSGSGSGTVDNPLGAGAGPSTRTGTFTVAGHAFKVSVTTNASTPIGTCAGSVSY